MADRQSPNCFERNLEQKEMELRTVRMFRLSIIFSVLFFTSVSGDYYSAISELEKLLDVEAFIVEKFDEYLERAQQEQDSIKRCSLTKNISSLFYIIPNFL